MAAQISEFSNTQLLVSDDPGGEGSDSASKTGDPEKMNNRAEIDTSAPFESVKEAVSRFGGIGFWKPTTTTTPFSEEEHEIEAADIAKVEAQAAQLEKDLILKERETLDVLKELESTKLIVEQLKLKIQKEASEVNGMLNHNLDDMLNHNLDDMHGCHDTRLIEKEFQGNNSEVNSDPSQTSDDMNRVNDELAEEEFQENVLNGHQKHSVGRLDLCPSSTPGFILMELKQAKLNLSRTTSDLADIRATVESYNKKIEKERKSLEKTRLRLYSSSSKITSLEQELNQTKQNLQSVKDAEFKGGSDNMRDISKELQRLSSEAEQFKQLGEAARSEVIRAVSEIEQTKSRIRTAEFRLIAAKKMKKAARATEAVALAEIEALSKSENTCEDCQETPEKVSLSFEEYSSLTSRALRAEKLCRKKEADAMVLVNEANVSKSEILKRVEEVTKEVKTSKRVLEEALKRVEAANRGKLAVEEALRKWRSENGQKRRSIQNSTKFKNSSHQRKDPRLLDVNGLNMMYDSKPLLRPTLSIGQILSRKLLLTEDFENDTHAEHSIGKLKVSLGQMLTKSKSADVSRKSERESDHKQLLAKRKKFAFPRISLLVTKQSKKKKRQIASSRVTVCSSVDIDR